MQDPGRFRAVIFDFDGVIVDSEPMQARAWTRVARELGLSECDVTVEQIAGRLDIELAAHLFPGRDARQCAQRKQQIEYEMEAAGELRLVAGVEEFIRRLAATHTMAICSSCHIDLLRRRLSAAGLASLFGSVTGRCDGVHHKPAPDLYLRTLADLEIPADEACAIEDSLPGIAAAKAASLYAIQLVHPGLPRSPHADRWISSFAELVIP
jgi:HAD superfamily hydrolase (TIGR01509 family)